MTKRYFNWLLMAVVTTTITMGIVSCKDDDDDSSNSEQRNDDADALDTDQTQTAWRWLCAMTDAQTITDDWNSKTYEPTIGQPSQGNSLTRIVVVSDFEEAAQQFAGIADVEVGKLAQQQTFSQDGVGTLDWTPSNAGAQNLAEVTVNTKLIPNLQKIVYCTADQVGENGIFFDNVKGTAYYRFGDIVRDKEGYYWVCVRPSFAPDKGESHWINIFNASESGGLVDIPQENLYTKYNNLAKYNNQTIILPTKLTYKREHISNLSNLLWAMLDPVNYKTMCEKGKGLGGFKYDFNGANFAKRVATFWKEQTYKGYSMWEIIFGCTYEDMKKMMAYDFFYKGYSWTWGQTGYLWRFNSTSYQKNIPGSESGDKYKLNFAIEGFDANYLAHKPGLKDVFVLSSELSGAWLVRYKRGDQLWSGNGDYSPYEKMKGCEDIYRYNTLTGRQVHSDLETEAQALAVPMLSVQVGDIVAQDGNFYRTMDDVNAANTTAAAIVCYVNPGGKAVETGTYYHGLAVAVKDSKANTWLGEDKFMTCTGNPIPDVNEAMKTYDGMAICEKLRACTGHTHPFVGSLELFDRVKAANYTNNIFSAWFVPSLGQMVLAFDGMGLKPESHFDWYNFVPKVSGKTYQDVIMEFFDYGKKGNPFEGVKYNEPSQGYWMATEVDDYQAWRMFFSPKSDFSYVDEDGKTIKESREGNVHMAKYDKYVANASSLMRPFIAFGSSGK